MGVLFKVALEKMSGFSHYVKYIHIIEINHNSLIPKNIIASQLSGPFHNPILNLLPFIGRMGKNKQMRYQVCQPVSQKKRYFNSIDDTCLLNRTSQNE